MTSTNAPSFRAQILTRRTYNRPLNPEGTVFETWAETIDRVIEHQRWLWKRAQGRPLNKGQDAEMAELRQLLLDRKVGVAGRTLWLGGTEVAKRREASNFNCSFTRVETVNDVVDCLWLLLQGCGVGFAPVTGTLSGFTKPIHNIEFLRSTRTIAQWEAGERGREANVETWDADTRTWTVSVGDSAEAWAKSLGKILAGKNAAEKLVIDLTQIRPAGVRLRGYGWISQGDNTIATAYEAICKIMNQRSGQLLRKMDIHDLVNWLGTILSTRRSAEISLFDYGSPEWEEFAVCKKDYWSKGQPQRGQSNNSVVFHTKPSRDELKRMFDMMLAAGGSEPGMINGEAALKRAPWFSGLNPCAEILLANKGFCNLVTVVLSKFRDDPAGLLRAIYLIARANYRQTCVNLKDGILQDAWHENNQFLRLCGVSLTGIAERPDIGPYEKRVLKNMAISGAYSMAEELGLPKPKNVTTIKPEGTGSKCYDATEGVHKPLAKYIFNNVVFGHHDPLVPVLREAGYTIFEHPNKFDWVVALPVAWENVEFDKVGDLEVNLETAVAQLERYKEMMDNYVEQNCSITVSYDPSEVPAIVDWLMENWDHYVGVSFLLRADPTKTAADLGYPYLPQQPVTKEVYEEYAARLKPINVESLNEQSEDEVDAGEECSTGACPIR
jgi:adenosylcobalamin-dependent ribonucleoside-triphosphate reductase